MFDVNKNSALQEHNLDSAGRSDQLQRTIMSFIAYQKVTQGKCENKPKISINPLITGENKEM